jgi:hypothetical protein
MKKLIMWIIHFLKDHGSEEDFKNLEYRKVRPREIYNEKNLFQ